MMLRVLGLVMLSVTAAFSQVPRIEPGVSLELAKWRAERYSDVRYKLNLTLEKMSPVLKGHMEIRVTTQAGEGENKLGLQYFNVNPIILDWRKLPGHEKDSTVSNVTLNGDAMQASDPSKRISYFEESNGHLVFQNDVVVGENVIKLDFTSPILTSGSAITRYLGKEDGAEYIYSHFAPSDASTAFPVFDQPDLKARFSLTVDTPGAWRVVGNTDADYQGTNKSGFLKAPDPRKTPTDVGIYRRVFAATKPISTHVFSFAAGPLVGFREDKGGYVARTEDFPTDPVEFYKFLDSLKPKSKDLMNVYVRRSQYQKFQPQAAEAFRLSREAFKYLETYFNKKFPWPKYDLGLIPGFLGSVADGAGVAFLRESSVILPARPTGKETAERALAILHATAHQWTGEKALSKQLDQQWLRKVLPNLQP